MGNVLKKRLGRGQVRQWCPECGEYVQPVRPKANNLTINLLLSVLTLGIWALVWACTADLRTKEPYQCPACGARTQEMAAVNGIEELNSSTDDAT